jgi:hypothetical protein
VKVPLVCLPPVSGTADVFFKQILALSAKGIRVIAVRKFYTALVLTYPYIFYVTDRPVTFNIFQKVKCSCGEVKFGSDLYTSSCITFLFL